MQELCPQSVATLGVLAVQVQSEGAELLEELFAETPLLVVRPLQDPAADVDIGSQTVRIGPGSSDLSLSETQSGEGVSPWAAIAQEDSLVVPLFKSDRNPFLGVLALGRGKANDVQLFSREVSKRHALIRQGTGGWLIQDHGSRNGTFHNGQRLESTQDKPLRSGDEVRLADVHTMFLDRTGLETLCQIFNRTVT